MLPIAITITEFLLMYKKIHKYVVVLIFTAQHTFMQLLVMVNGPPHARPMGTVGINVQKLPAADTLMTGAPQAARGAQLLISQEMPSIHLTDSAPILLKRSEASKLLCPHVTNRHQTYQ